ncbi:MAG: HNH endonuclease signature motif containing protein [Actinomycetaceae bacterium]|nr:HNH endonuclease signature motif containing protein [Actinomycetaceae bacterium]
MSTDALLTENELEQFVDTARRLYAHCEADVDSDHLRSLLKAKRFLSAACEKAITVANTRVEGIDAADIVSEVEKTTTNESNSIVVKAIRNTEYPLLQEAWANGEVSDPSRRQGVNTLTKLKSVLDAQQFEDAQNKVVDIVRNKRGQQLTRSLNELVQSYPGTEDNDNSVQQMRHINFQAVPGGWRFNGLLPTAAGDEVRRALGTIARQLRAEEINERGKDRVPLKISRRLADALTHLCRKFNDQFPKATQLYPLATIVDANTLPKQQRSEIIAAEYDGRYDLGRSRRLADAKLRSLVLERDRGCLFPHCDAIETTCEINHIRPRSDGGGTNLDNLAALCPHHHWIIDNPKSDFQITTGPKNLPRVVRMQRTQPQRE